MKALFKPVGYVAGEDRGMPEYLDACELKEKLEGTNINVRFVSLDLGGFVDSFLAVDTKHVDYLSNLGITVAWFMADEEPYYTLWDSGGFVGTMHKVEGVYKLNTMPGRRRYVVDG